MYVSRIICTKVRFRPDSGRDAFKKLRIGKDGNHGQHATDVVRSVKKEHLQQAVIPYLAIDLVQFYQLAAGKGILSVKAKIFLQCFLLAVGQLEQIF